MTFIDNINTMLNASQPLVWVRTHEATEARLEIQQKFIDRDDVRVYRWDVLNGLTSPQGEILKIKATEGSFGGDVPFTGPEGLVAAVGYMLTLIDAKSKEELDEELATKEPPKAKAKAVDRVAESIKTHYLLIIDNFHHLCDAFPIIQALQDFAAATRRRPSMIAMICHYDRRIGADLKSYCSIVEHDLPNPSELFTLTTELMAGNLGSINDLCSLLDNDKLAAISRAGMGLSRMQFQSELAVSLANASAHIKAGNNLDVDSLTTFLVEMVQDRKAALFNAEGLIQLQRSTESAAEIGGMEGLKQRLKTRFARQKERNRKDKFPKGIILLGPPGTAKSTMARAVSNMLGVLMAAVDIGSVKDGIVGATEGRIRRVFQILNAMGRIVVFVDEIEKAFPTGDERDSGVSADMLQVWLTNLSDPNRQYYMVASANNCAKLPAPLLRNGRFDNVYMCDIPTPEQQALIWDICRRRYGITDEVLPECTDWTGAEIEACCDEADGMDVSLVEAAKVIVPTIKKNPAAVKAVREYAHNLAIDAETGTIYHQPGSPEAIAAREKTTAKTSIPAINRRRAMSNN